MIGAGPVGATLAARLASAGIDTAVIDAAPLPPMEMPAFDGRAYAIALTSKRLLEAAGVWERLPVEPCPILGIRVADGRPGEAPSPLSLHFDHAAIGDEPFGWMVEARSLRIALNAHLPKLPNLAVHAFNPLTSYAPDFLPIEIVDIYQDVTWYSPRLRNGQFLCVPIDDGEKPRCLYFVKEISRNCEIVDYGKIF